MEFIPISTKFFYFIISSEINHGNIQAKQKIDDLIHSMSNVGENRNYGLEEAVSKKRCLCLTCILFKYVTQEVKARWETLHL